ncbi:MAG: mechanosensitive ion channel family protein [Treponema sp.]|jgi:small-conductance mechanosensitive channel|nr:mechanosensitive ion channel family protein [Treponema sp.]
METLVESIEQTEDATVGIVDNLVHENIFMKLGLCIVILIVTVLLIKLVAYLFKKIEKKVALRGGERIKPIVFKKLQLLGAEQILKIVLFLLRIIKYVVYLIIGYLTLVTAFALFEQTKNIAFTLLSYILNPLKNTGLAIIGYIPNLITIIITCIISHYFIRLVRFFTIQIEKRKLVLPGFYPDWAQPTFNILRVLIYAFTLIIVYPMLPHSESDIFKGVSVFIGILFSFGSTSIIGNLVAGVVVTYMRPFNLGDRIKIGDTVGFVVEKSATVTRLRTHKNEYVTFPNLTILTSSITNYTFATKDKHDKGVILYTEITFGYHTSYELVEKLLLDAAELTHHILKEPKPFVLHTRMDDFYATYQINVYTKEFEKIPAIYSELHKNIQVVFEDAGLDMTATHYYTVVPPGDAESVDGDLTPVNV